MSVAGAKRLSPALAQRNAQGYVPDAVNCVLCVGIGWHRSSPSRRSPTSSTSTAPPGPTMRPENLAGHQRYPGNLHASQNRLPHPVRWTRTAPPRWAGRRGADDDLQFIQTRTPTDILFRYLTPAQQEAALETLEAEGSAVMRSAGGMGIRKRERREGRPGGAPNNGRKKKNTVTAMTGRNGTLPIRESRRSGGRKRREAASR